MEKAVTYEYCFENIAAFRQSVKDCQRNIETKFPNFPKNLLRDLKDFNMVAEQIDDLLEEINKAKTNVDEYTKHLAAIKNNLKDIQLCLMEKGRGLRGYPGRNQGRDQDGKAESGTCADDSSVSSQSGIQEENGFCIVAHPTVYAERDRQSSSENHEDFD